MTLGTFFVSQHRMKRNRKGVGILSAKGYIQVRAFASNAQIPLNDVAVSVTKADNSVVALRLTNRNGQLDIPIEIDVPDFSAGQNPDTGVVPFAVVNLYARLDNYEAVEINNLQIFPDRTTVQNLEMIPLSELPSSWNKVEIFNTTPQNL